MFSVRRKTGVPYFIVPLVYGRKLYTTTASYTSANTNDIIFHCIGWRYDEVLTRFARQILSERGLAFSGFNMMQPSPTEFVPRISSLCNVAARGLVDNNILDEEIKHGPTLPDSASRLPDDRKFNNTLLRFVNTYSVFFSFYFSLSSLLGWKGRKVTSTKLVRVFL